jgi:NTP pyrophosphatase (non-canonical NTP hydrolase)
MSESDYVLRYMTFIHGFQELQADAAAINKQSGFSDDDALFEEFRQWFRQRENDDNAVKFVGLFDAFRNARKGLKLALVMGEIGEALEAVRKNKGADDHIPSYTAEEAEIADAVIRLMNYATDRKLRLAEAIFAKNEYNRTRHDHSKEGRAAVNGKKF